MNFLILPLASLAVAAVLKGILTSRRAKGWMGEKGVQFALWRHLDERVYQRCHDVIIEVRGGTTQIDHVLVSIYGIFVVEAKNYGGWIFGDENEAQWTQVFPNGRKFRFQNPLRQNYRHTKCLAEYLGLPHEIFHSVVFFIGECTLKTELPRNVMTNGCSTYIQSFTDPILTSAQMEEIIGKLKSARTSPTQTRATHLQSLVDRHDSTTICPKCGNALIEKTAKKGPNAGNLFLACSAFPQCRYIKK